MSTNYPLNIIGVSGGEIKFQTNGLVPAAADLGQLMVAKGQVQKWKCAWLGGAGASNAVDDADLRTLIKALKDGAVPAA